MEGDSQESTRQPKAPRKPPPSVYPLSIGEAAPVSDGSIITTPHPEGTFANSSNSSSNPLFAHSPRPTGKPRGALPVRAALSRSTLARTSHGEPPPNSFRTVSRTSSNLKEVVPVSLPNSSSLSASTSSQLKAAVGSAIILLLLLGFVLQHSASIASELRVVRTQLSWYQTFINTDPSALPPVPQRAPRQAPHAPAPPAASPSDRAPPFSAPQPPSSLYSTVPEPSGPYPPYTGPQAVYHEHGHAVPLQPQTSGEGRVLGRIVAAFLAIGCVTAGLYTWHNLDALPTVVQTFIRGFISRDDKSAASIAASTSLSKHVAYKMDYWLSRNHWAKALALVWVILAMIYIGGLGIYAVSGQPLHESFWEAIAGAGFDWKFSEVAVLGAGLSGFLTRSMSVVVSIGGMLITALLLGIVSDTIGDKMEGLRKGKAEVLEAEHTLLLGWSDKLLAIVDQICNANASEGGRPIVILAEKDKVEMEEAIDKHSPNLRGSRVICRSGNPLLTADLARVSAERARSIIVLANPGEPAQSDARTLRTTLSLMGLHDSRIRAGLPGLAGHVVAEVCDMDNDALVRMVGGDLVETVVSHDIIGRLMIQCARQPGLASVWEQLLGFDGGCSHDSLAGDEFYIKAWPELEGRTFNEVLISFPAATPVGLKLGASGTVVLNPESDYVLETGDAVIVLAEDDDVYAPGEQLPQLNPMGACPAWHARARRERVLFLGWRRDMHDMIEVLDQFVSKGSELFLYNEVPPAQRLPLLIKGGLNPDKDLENLKLIFQEAELEGDPVNRMRLEQLHPERFSSVLILADESARVSASVQVSSVGASIADADSRCLASLLLLRDIQSTRMPLTNKSMHASVMTGQDISSMGGSLSSSRSNMARKSWFGKDLAAAAQQAECEGEDVSEESQASNAWYNTLMGAVRQTVVISEILDSRTRNLISDLHIGEFVLSNELVSMTLAMVSENRDVNTLLRELFTPAGNELYVLPAARYLRGGELLNFYEVLMRGRARSEIIIGYKNYGMDQPEVNPKDKSSQVLSIDLTDTFVVLSTGIEADASEPQSTRRKAKSDFIEGLAYMKMPSFTRS